MEKTNTYAHVVGPQTQSECSYFLFQQLIHEERWNSRMGRAHGLPSPTDVVPGDAVGAQDGLEARSETAIRGSSGIGVRQPGTDHDLRPPLPHRSE